MFRYGTRRRLPPLLMVGSLTLVGLFLPAAGAGERASAAAYSASAQINALALAPTATPTGGSGSCLGIWSPGFWKNYSNHYTDAQFAAFLSATLNFNSLSIAGTRQADLG